MNNQSLLLLQVLLLLIVLTAGCENPDPASSYPEPFYGQLLVGDTLLSPVPQQKSTREFEPVATVETRQFTFAPALAIEDTPAELVMTKPNRAVFSRDGDMLFLLDTESLLINQYSLLDGSLIKVIKSANESRAPNSYLASIGLISDNELGVTGVEARKTMRIDSDGKSLGFIDQASGESFVGMSSGKIVQIQSNNEYELFHVYNESGKKQQAFGLLSSMRYELGGNKLNGHGMGFAGTLATDGSESFVYTSGFGSGLLGYQTDGNVLYFREVIDHTPFPEMIASEGENTFTVDNEEMVASRMSLNVWDNVYYQYAFGREGQEPVVDAYDYRTGDYLYSLKSPAECGIILVSSDHVYATCLDRGFIQFERPVLGSLKSKAKS